MTHQQTLTDMAVQDEIRSLEAKRYDAMLRQDFEAFEEMSHANLIYTHSNGERDSLQSYIEKCKAGVYVYHQIDHPIHDVVLEGNVAVVVGDMRADISVSGVPKTLDNTSIAVWTRKEAQWKLLAYQPTPKPTTAS